LEIGANLFVGNLDSSVDEKMIYDTFSAFGMIIQTPKIARDTETGLSKGYAFVSYDSFDAADAAIESMDGQFLANSPVTVSYAFKKDGRGERHGTAAERLLAAQAKKLNIPVLPVVTPATPNPTVPQPPTPLPMLIPPSAPLGMTPMLRITSGPGGMMPPPPPPI